MSPLAVLRTALSAIASNKLRAGLTLLGIVIGVASVISLMAIGRGSQEAITSRIEELGTNLLFVNPVSSGTDSSGLTLEDATALIDPLFAPSVEAVAPTLDSWGQIVWGRENTKTQLVGVTPEYESIRNFSVASGEFISEQHVEYNAEVAVLGSDVAETLFGLRDPVGANIRIEGRQFTVIGVLESQGGSFGGTQDNQVLVPITTAYYRLSAERTTQGEISVSSINVQVKEGISPEDAIDEVSMVLRLRHRITGEDDFTVTSQQETIETLEETTNTFVVFLGAIASISLIVGGIGIMNIMLVSVTERTREIGIMKAMGAKRRNVLFQFLTEATLLSFGGGLVGVVLGVGLSWFLNGRSLMGMSFQTAFSGDIAVLAVFVSVAIGLFSGVYPAMRAARLHPIEALRYE
jgi:putative ABC transport system permease protein